MKGEARTEMVGAVAVDVAGDVPRRDVERFVQDALDGVPDDSEEDADG